MKVHRLVTMKRLCDGKLIGAVEDTTTFMDAVQGLDLGASSKALDGGKPFRSREIVAGIQISIVLVPSHARNRAALLETA